MVTEKQKINKLKMVIAKALPVAINEFNTIRKPALEQAWGHIFKNEFINEDVSQRTVEITKSYTRPLNNSIYREIKKNLSNFEVATTNGSDLIYDGLPIEDKNSFSNSDSWTGNGFPKVPYHLLKKFTINDDGVIIKAFVAIVDTSKCTGSWTAKTTKRNSSSLKFAVSDEKFVEVIFGKINKKRKWLDPVQDPI
jgi:hypothetical protein